VQITSPGTDASCFHVLQEPQTESAGGPFVGNETLDDNLAESAQIAAWKAIRGRCDCLTVSVSGGSVTLSGTVQSDADAERCEAAVQSVEGVRQVVNNLTRSAPAPAARLEPDQSRIQPPVTCPLAGAGLVERNRETSR
jgi:hypothetical protein